MSKADFLAETVAPDVLEREYKAAQQMVSDLCNGRREWLMSIPARPDYDPDLVISSALRHLHNEVERLRAAAETDAAWREYAGDPGEHWPSSAGDLPYPVKLDLRDGG